MIQTLQVWSDQGRRPKKSTRFLHVAERILDSGRSGRHFAGRKYYPLELCTRLRQVVTICACSRTVQRAKFPPNYGAPPIFSLSRKMRTPPTIRPENIVHFLRKRDYTLIRKLGQGGCGQTVLLHDDEIDEHFVCKKYVPYSEAERQPLFRNFVREIKLLHKVHHQNVVRVFNHYLYSDQFTGYILMEFVDGAEVDDYLAKKPEQTNEVFLQAVTGFSYLERIGILHRDIRPGNLMVTEDGVLKIIDCGF